MRAAALAVALTGCNLIAGLYTHEERPAGTGGGSASASSAGGGGSAPLEPLVALGAYYTCVRKSDASLSCWGADDRGQQGDGQSTKTLVPTPEHAVGPVAGIALGGVHSCAYGPKGALTCWGDNNYGQLGIGTTDAFIHTPAPTKPPLVGVKGVALGAGHSCAIRADGTGVCWGNNGYGRLCDGTTTDRYTPTPVLLLTDIEQIAAGEDHTCALVGDDTVSCCGVNLEGQLGLGSADGDSHPKPNKQVVGGLGGVTEIALGRAHSCALKNDGTVWCWGANDHCQLGAVTGTCGAKKCSPTPIQVAALAGVEQIAAGYDHTCALAHDGTVRCWGADEHGQLGDDQTTDRCGPVVVTSGVSQIALGGQADGSHSCALKNTGALACWGFNQFGQLGDGTTTEQHSPELIAY